MGNTRIDKKTFDKFIADNGWLEIYTYHDPRDDSHGKVIRYVAPTGIQTTTIHTDNTVEVRCQ